MCSSAITWRLLTPSTSTLRRISIQRSILVNTPSSRYKSSELRNKLSGMGWGVSHFSTGFLESQTAALFDRRLHFELFIHGRPLVTTTCGPLGRRLTGASGVQGVVLA